MEVHVHQDLESVVHVSAQIFIECMILYKKKVTQVFRTVSEISFILVTIGCGGSSSENCTYFEVSSLTTTGACSGKICKLSSDICQVSIRHIWVGFINYNK